MFIHLHLHAGSLTQRTVRERSQTEKPALRIYRIIAHLCHDRIKGFRIVQLHGGSGSGSTFRIVNLHGGSSGGILIHDTLTGSASRLKWHT